MSALFSVRKMLMGWGFRAPTIKVEEDEKSLKVAGVVVLTITVKELQLVF